MLIASFIATFYSYCNQQRFSQLSPRSSPPVLSDGNSVYVSSFEHIYFQNVEYKESSTGETNGVTLLSQKEIRNLVEHGNIPRVRLATKFLESTVHLLENPFGLLVNPRAELSARGSTRLRGGEVLSRTGTLPTGSCCVNVCTVPLLLRIGLKKI